MFRIKTKIGNFIRKWANADYEQIRQYEDFKLYHNRLTWETVHCNELGVSCQDYGNEVIVSLTSFGRRVYEVYAAIESIMQGTMKPNRIVLWLQEDMRNDPLPITLTNQIKRGLEVYFYKDIKSYKKLIPSLKRFPDAVIITIDDDLLYPFDTVENLVRAYQSNPSFIYCSRYHGMTFDSNGILLPYMNWRWNFQGSSPSHLNFATTGAGTLFPPHCFKPELFDEDLFMSICPTADDVWINAMAIYSGVKRKKVFTHDEKRDNYYENNLIQSDALSTSINIPGGNDRQIKAVFDKFEIVNKLRDCLNE